MVSFLLRRLVALIPVLALVLVIAFSLVRIIPGDPAVTLLGPGATNEQIAALRLQLGLDRPAAFQFFDYVGGLLQGNLGTSLKTGNGVLQEILLRLPATLELSICATVLAILIGIPIGVLSATWPNSGAGSRHARGVTRGRVHASLSAGTDPATDLCHLSRLASCLWPDQPVRRHADRHGLCRSRRRHQRRFRAMWSAVQHLVLPTTVLAAFLAATLGRFVRNTMLEVMTEDYIRTARAKGLSRSSVILHHGLRNSLLPAITIMGLKFAEMLGGAILTETIFAWPGVGRFMFEAIKNRDYPVIQGTTLIFALLFVATSLLVDLLYGVLDPRVRRKMQ